MVASLPTGNANLPHLVAGFDTIVSALDYAALGDTGVSLFSSRGMLEHAMSYGELRHRAVEAGLRLQNCGLSRGDRVVLVAETSPEFLVFFYGCQYVGLVPCPVPYTAYVGGKDAYILRLASLVSAASARILCAPAKMTEIAVAAAERAGARALAYDEILESRPSGGIMPFRADEMAYIQFSSGSTSRPKGVPVTQKAISSNVRGILRQGMRLTPHDRAFSWLPLYHDMGLVGFSISPLYGQCSVDNISASAFARRPHLWVDLMSQNGSTITYAPTFGYRLAAQRFSDPSNSIDLSRLRIAGIGGDMVRADVLDRFSSVLEPAGFNPDAFTPSYGMAESTLLISVAHGVKTDVIDRDDFGANRVATPVAASEPEHSGATRRFVICGRVLTEHELIVADNFGRALPDRHLGHIQIRGPSLMPGYFNAQSLTDAVMREDGFMDTGDMGYLVQGEVVITGRSKDMILHKGRNVWPEDLEWAAEKVAPLTDGDVAAFGVDLGQDDEEIILLVQARVSGEDDQKKLRQRVAAAVSEAAGVSCRVVLVSPKTLTFTSSGKLARSAARDGYLAGTINDIDAQTA